MSEVHDAVGSYVVNALDPPERVEFEAHLPTCNRCRLEVAEFRETVAELTVLVATPPPAALRTSLLAAIGSIRPAASEADVRVNQQANLGVRPAPAVLRTSVLAGTQEAHPVVTDEVAPLEEHPSIVPDWSWSVPLDHPPEELAVRPSRRVQRLLTALVAAVAVVSLALGGWVYVLSQRNEAQLAAAQQETQLLGAPDAEVFRSTVNGASVVYVVSKQRDQALLLAHDLPDPGRASTYQLWTLQGTAATSAGLVGTGGTVSQWFSGPVHDADALAVSREPSSNGSTTPSLPALSSVSI